MRRIRKITVFACTTCYQLFPTSAEAKTHATKHPRVTSPRSLGPRRTQVGAILEAVRGGAKSASAVKDKTGIPLERVHSLLSYHRRRGNIRGHTGQLKATA